jgi:hypothetical protein
MDSSLRERLESVVGCGRGNAGLARIPIHAPGELPMISMV